MQALSLTVDDLDGSDAEVRIEAMRIFLRAAFLPGRTTHSPKACAEAGPPHASTQGIADLQRSCVRAGVAMGIRRADAQGLPPPAAGTSRERGSASAIGTTSAPGRDAAAGRPGTLRGATFWRSAGESQGSEDYRAPLSSSSSGDDANDGGLRGGLDALAGKLASPARAALPPRRDGGGGAGAAAGEGEAAGGCHDNSVGASAAGEWEEVVGAGAYRFWAGAAAALIPSSAEEDEVRATEQEGLAAALSMGGGGRRSGAAGRLSPAGGEDPHQDA